MSNNGYGKVLRSIWDDDEFLALSAPERDAWNWFMTGPQGTPLGVWRLGRHMLRAALADPSELESTLDKLQDMGWIQLCSETGWVWVCSYLKINEPANPNSATSLRRQVDQIPDNCRFKTAVSEAVETVCQRFPNRSTTVSKPLPNGSTTVTEPFANPDPDPDPDPEPKEHSSAQSQNVDRPANGLFGPSPGKDSGSVPKNGSMGNERLNTHPDHRPFIAVPLAAPADVERLWVIREDEVQQYERDYPHLDVEGELRKFRAWCRDNPGRRKTARGIRRAMSGWLNRAQDGNGRRRV